MPEIPSHPDRLRRYAGRLAGKARPRHLAAVLAVAVVAAGLAGVGSLALPGPRPVLDSERMRIQVVAPVEPEILAGPVMEVGALVDALESPPPSGPAPEPEPVAYVPDDEEFDAGNPPSPPKRYVETAVVHAPPQPEPVELDRRDRRAGRWFGFDGPERDYRAEREARRARREAWLEREREREGDGRVRRWYRSDGRPVEPRDGDPD